MMSQRWMVVTEPQFPWERSALTYLRERLPALPQKSVLRTLHCLFYALYNQF
jgi:hypothetical protein